MNNFEIIETPIPDCIVILTNIYSDNRGSFCETYKKDSFMELGISNEFIQDNQSISRFNVVRGLHFQKDKPQGKLVRVPRGKIIDVCVDLRNGKTFGKYFMVELSEFNLKQLYLPPGTAHGFLCKSEFAVVNYKCTDYYDPNDEFCIKWNDPTLNIQWMIGKDCAIVSEKDKKGMLFEEYLNKM